MTILGWLRPDDTLGGWKYIHLLEELGEIGNDEATLWKQAIYRLMATWRLEPDHLVSPICLDVEGTAEPDRYEREAWV